MKYSFILLFFVFSFINLHAQEDELLPYNYYLETTSGEIVAGELISISIDSVLIYIEDIGLRSINKKDIKEIRKGRPSSAFEEITNSSVPYYVQSAMLNGAGNHYYKNYFLFGNEFNFGINDNWNLSAGFETATLLFDTGQQLPTFQIGTKVGTSIVENVHIGISSKLYFHDSDDALMLSIPITIGNKRSNFTIAPIRIAADDSENYGIFTNFSLPIGSKYRFILDFVRINKVLIYTALIEYQFQNGFSLSVGGFFTKDGSIPNVSFSIPFGNWKN